MAAKKPVLTSVETETPKRPNPIRSKGWSWKGKEGKLEISVDDDDWGAGAPIELEEIPSSLSVECAEVLIQMLRLAIDAVKEDHP